MVSYNRIVAVEVVVSRCILKGKLNRLTHGLDVVREREVKHVCQAIDLIYHL